MFILPVILICMVFSSFGAYAEGVKARDNTAFILEKKEIEKIKAKELIEVLNQIPGMSADNF